MYARPQSASPWQQAQSQIPVLVSSCRNQEEGTHAGETGANRCRPTLLVGTHNMRRQPFEQNQTSASCKHQQAENNANEITARKPGPLLHVGEKCSPPPALAQKLCTDQAGRAKANVTMGGPILHDDVQSALPQPLARSPASVSCRNLQEGTLANDAKASPVDAYLNAWACSGMTAKFNRHDVVSAVKEGTPGRPGIPGQIYIAGRVLGKGNFGTTYQAMHRRTGEERVIKMVSKEQSLKGKVDIHREIDVLALLDHPHILRLFECYNDETHAYLVVDVCYGGDVFDIVLAQMNKKERLAEPFAARIFSQSLEALAYCHEKGVMHKDLKFENIMLRTQVTSSSPIEDIHVVLIDVGLAELFGPEHGKSTHSDVPAGTPVTMAPEVIARHFTCKCDIWSLGCLLFAFLNVEVGRDGWMYPFKPKPTTEDPLGIASLLNSYMVGPPMEKICASSPEAQHVARLMLTYDGEARPGAKELLATPWFSSSCTTPPTFSKQQLHAITDIKQNIWWSAVATHGVAQLPAAKTAKIEELFHAIDVGHSGSISKRELVVFLSNSGVPGTVAERAFETLDLDNSGTLDWSEFVAALLPASPQLFESTLQASFQSLDTNHDGSLDYSEVTQLMKTLLPRSVDPSKSNTAMTPNIADLMMRELGKNSDGLISFQEFRSFFASILACVPMSTALSPASA